MNSRQARTVTLIATLAACFAAAAWAQATHRQPATAIAGTAVSAPLQLGAGRDSALPDAATVFAALPAAAVDMQVPTF